MALGQEVSLPRDAVTKVLSLSWTQAHLIVVLPVDVVVVVVVGAARLVAEMRPARRWMALALADYCWSQLDLLNMK